MCHTICKDKSVAKLYMKTAPLEKASSVALAANRHPVLLTCGMRDSWGLIPNLDILLSGSELHSQAFKILRKYFTCFLRIYFLLYCNCLFVCVLFCHSYRGWRAANLISDLVCHSARNASLSKTGGCCSWAHFFAASWTDSSPSIMLPLTLASNFAQ